MPRYLTLSLQDSLHLSIIVGLLHLTLKREPKRIHEDFFVFTRISSNSGKSEPIGMKFYEETYGRMARSLANLWHYPPNERKMVPKKTHFVK